MTFPTGVDFRKYSDEELTTMLAEAGEASKHARKRVRVMGIVAAHRLEQIKKNPFVRRASDLKERERL